MTPKELYEKQKYQDRINSLWHEVEHLKELLETANHTIHTLVHKYNIHTP